MRPEQAEKFEESEDGGPADSGFRTRPKRTLVLRAGQREHRLLGPSATLGRSAACDIQIPSGLVSRRHARISITELGVMVEDLGSRNGVYVNSEKVVGSVKIGVGDRLVVGDETLVLAELREPLEAQHADTVAAMPTTRSSRDSFSDDDTSVATRSADIFQLLGHVVDKTLALGRGEEAEHMIAAHLQAALADARSERKLAPDIARTAAGYAVKLAAATGKPIWLDYAIELYDSLELVLPLALVDEMYVLLRRVRGIDLGVLRVYTEALRARALKLAPAERFVLQRLIGLERLAAWQTSATKH